MSDQDATLTALVVVFAQLSLVSIGGGASVFSEMQHQAVAVHGWMTQREFADLFAIARAAPGPGSLLATLIGWQAAGWQGALAVTLAFFGPSSALVYVASQVWNRWRGSAWHRLIEDALAPVASGLVLAGGYAILAGDDSSVAGWITALAVAALQFRWPRLHPLLLLAVGALMFVALGALVPQSGAAPFAPLAAVTRPV